MQATAQKLSCQVHEMDMGKAASDLLLISHNSMQSVNGRALTFNGL